MLTKRHAAWLLIIFSALACAQAAQPSAFGQRTPQEAEQRKRDEEAVRNMPDHGSDLAVVTSRQAAIYEQARANSRVLLQVKRGEFLALVEREPTGVWHRVVHVDTAHEGWIHQRDVVIKLTSKESAGPPIEEEKGTNTDPEVHITNSETSTDLRLRLNGTLHMIPASTTRVLTLKAGVFKYYGYSPGIRPAFGSRTFRQGYKYTWVFQIVRR